MKIETGYLYHIKDEFFDKINDKEIMINHENGHSRPSYLVVKDKNILWFIPLSTKVSKYKKIIDNKIKKYGGCRTILIRKIAGREQVILIQNAFPTIEKYIQSRHIVGGKYIKVSNTTQKEIMNSIQYMFSKKEKGVNLFFTDIDRIKEMMLDELEKDKVFN